jgi:MFS family permease
VPDAATDQKPSGRERRAILLLGLPTFALALAITVVTTYLPLIARQFTSSSTVVGLVIGSEGMLALVLPLAVGTWSDQLHTRIGGRLPFLIAATPPLVVALAVLGFAGSMAMTVGLVLLFFAAYFVAYEPYRALYPDLVSDEHAGRSQSVQAVWRGIGTGLALVAGGLLFALVHWLPFTAAAVVTVIAMAVFLLRTTREPDDARRDEDEQRGPREAAQELRALVREHPALRAYLVANALWEASLGALKTFVVLFITVGLGMSVSEAALIVGAGALVALGASVVSGRLADRHGHLRVLGIALPLYGIGLLAPALTTATVPLVLVLPLVAFGGGIVMTLPYALLMPMMPHGSHGALTGYYSLSRGLGTMLGPLLAGVAVDGLKGVFGSTQGYAAIWLVCSGTVLLSVVFLARLGAAREDRERLAQEADEG